jgi:hypothetical protein
VANGDYKRLWPSDDSAKYNVTDVQAAINNTDRKLASEIMTNLVKKYLTPALFNRIFTASEPCAYDFYRAWELM